MKKLVFGLMGTVMFGFVGNAQTFEESVTIVTKARVALRNNTCENMSAKSVELFSNNDKFKLPQAILLAGVKLTDDGKGNDLKEGDGIYTSVGAFENPREKSEGYVITFEGNDNPAGGGEASKGHVKIKCHIEYVWEIPYIVCDVDIEFVFD